MLAFEIKSGSRIKLGGMVKIGSIRRVDTDIFFIVTDFESEVPVTFRGITPDLFKEYRGLVARLLIHIGCALRIERSEFG